MAQCTAPRLGHIRGGGADCPVHGHLYRRRYGGYGNYGGGSYSAPAYRAPAYTAPAPQRYPSYASRSGGGGGGGGGSSSRARRYAVTYSGAERATLDPVREKVVQIAETQPDLRDVFLCHAWADREGAALDLYNHLVGLDVKVWFSEKDVPLGKPLLSQINVGLRNSRTAVVLVTPALLQSLLSEGIADQELSALLFTDRVIPVMHGTTHEELRKVNPLLGSRAGLTTDGLSLEVAATKVADVALID